MRPLYNCWSFGSDRRIGKGIRMTKQKALPLFVGSKNRLWHQLPEVDRQRAVALYADNGTSGATIVAIVDRWGD
jgi:hypothetical protein